MRGDKQNTYIRQVKELTTETQIYKEKNIYNTKITEPILVR